MKLSILNLSSCLLAFSASSLAIPTLRRHSPKRAVDLSKFTVPTSNGSTSLPGPTGTLQAVTVGCGTQNYSCPTTDSPSAVPSQVGANATLFDISPILPYLDDANGASEILTLLPEFLLDFESLGQIASSADILGHHFFDAAGTPCFSIGNMGFVEGKKLGDIGAPPASDPGPFGKGPGAVDWLKLGATTGTQGRISQVYRVETAGGKPPATCKGKQGPFQVPYAATYWFYE